MKRNMVMSGDEELGQFWDKAKIISVEGGK